MSRQVIRLAIILPVAWSGIGCGTESDPRPVAESPTQESKQVSPVAPPTPAAKAQIEPNGEKTTVESPVPKLIASEDETDIVEADVPSPLSLGLPILEAPEPLKVDSQEATAAFERLVKAFRSGEPGQWTQAEAAIHEEGVNAVPVLLDGLNSEDQQTRELASMMLAQVLPDLLYSNDSSGRPDERELLDRLRPHLNAESVEVRVNVAVVLSMIENQPQELVPVLQELLESEKAHVRMMAVVALGGLGTAADPAIPLIKELSLSDPDAGTKTAAAEALSRLQSPE